MKTVWIKGLSERDQDEMRMAFLASAHVRERLIKILNEKINTSNKVARSKETYSVANWAYLQADAVGYERALTEVKSILSNVLTDEGARSDEPLGEEVGSRPKRRGRPPKSAIIS